MKKLIASSVALIASATASFAIPDPSMMTGTSVPEISALEGTAALAVVAATVLLVWERRRRAS